VITVGCILNMLSDKHCDVYISIKSEKYLIKNIEHKYMVP
jgi:hypothetical protein